MNYSDLSIVPLTPSEWKPGVTFRKEQATSVGYATPFGGGTANGNWVECVRVALTNIFPTQNVLIRFWRSSFAESEHIGSYDLLNSRSWVEISLWVLSTEVELQLASFPEEHFWFVPRETTACLRLFWSIPYKRQCVQQPQALLRFRRNVMVLRREWTSASQLTPPDGATEDARRGNEFEYMLHFHSYCVKRKHIERKMASILRLIQCVNMIAVHWS